MLLLPKTTSWVTIIPIHIRSAASRRNLVRTYTFRPSQMKLPNPSTTHEKRHILLGSLVAWLLLLRCLLCYSWYKAAAVEDRWRKRGGVSRVFNLILNVNSIVLTNWTPQQIVLLMHLASRKRLFNEFSIPIKTPSPVDLRRVDGAAAEVVVVGQVDQTGEDRTRQDRWDTQATKTTIRRSSICAHFMLIQFSALSVGVQLLLLLRCS